MSVQTVRQARIKPADLEQKFRELKGDVDEEVKNAKGYAIAAGVAVVVVVVTVSFLLGKRRGRKKSTFIEVRRV
ncbi:MAG: hypothetical protein ACRD0A_12945 [Acidimicrobiales bacterium]